MQANRQQIREQLAFLEEKLEELGRIAGANERQSLRCPEPLEFGSEVLFKDAIESLKSLGNLVHEQQLTKSVSASDFVQKILALLIQDASAQGCEIAVSHYGEGKISMEMAELVMGAIVAGFRASLRSQKSLSRQERARLNLFSPGSIYVEVQASPSEIQFRLTDDGAGYLPGEENAFPTGTDRQVDKLRDHIARCGGWFGRSSFPDFGGVIEFKVPLAHNRLDGLLVKDGEFEVLIPTTCVAERLERGQGRPPAGALVLRLSEGHGMVPGSCEDCVLLRIGVADVQFWIACESLGGKVLARKAQAEGFTAPDSWLQAFALFHSEGESRILPLFEGTALVRFYRENSGGQA